MLEKTWKKLLFQIWFFISYFSFILSGHMGQCDTDNQKSMLECAQIVIFEASCDVEANLLEMFCNWVVMHMTELVGGRQDQGLFLEQKLPVRQFSMIIS